MEQISMICAEDAKEWSKFLSKEILHLRGVNQFIVNARYKLPWNKIAEGLVCIILSPIMFTSRKDFIRESQEYFKNPIIVLCGVSEEIINMHSVLKPWRNCDTLTVTSNEKSADDFFQLVRRRCFLQDDSNNVTLIPDTVVQKGFQSCVLLFPKPVEMDVEVYIEGISEKLIVKQKNPQTYIFDVPGDLKEGKYKLNIRLFNLMIPIKQTLTITNPNPKPEKCLCDYIFQMLGSEDFHSFDKTITHSMENDYSNRLFFQNIHKPNPDFPEFPTPLHFAVQHGMEKVLEHLLTLPRANEGLVIRNNKNMDCFDIARNTKYSKSLMNILEPFYEGTYMDMTRGNFYSTMERLQ